MTFFLEIREDHSMPKREIRFGLKSRYLGFFGRRVSCFYGTTAVLILTLALAGCRKEPGTPGELTRLAAGTRTDKGMRGHFYTELYDIFFLPMKKTATKILEIGIGSGDSLKMWRDYFPRATIFGIDIFPKTELDSDRIKTFVADQADRTQLHSFVGQFGGYFDIIVDDGGHHMNHQQISLGFLFKYLKPGGYYVIEDVHMSLPRFWKGYGVKLDESNSTLNMVFEFIREMRLESFHMPRSEERYLTRYIEFCNLFMRNKLYVGSPSIMCIIKKRTAPRE
jgi:SAM-dependent methyltransferase